MTTAPEQAPPGRPSIGRPSKYGWIIMLLEEDVPYSPAAIARLAESKGWLSRDIPLTAGKADYAAALRLNRQRVRIAMGRFSINHDFPREGDGQVYLAGQSATPGWFGRRWQEAVRQRESL